MKLLRVDVPEPLYDDWRGIMVVPMHYSESDAAAAILELMRERR